MTRVFVGHFDVCDGEAAADACTSSTRRSPRSASVPNTSFTSASSSSAARRRWSTCLLGGLSSAIYNEVLQFFLIVAGFRAARVSRACATPAAGSGSRATVPRGVDARVARVRQRRRPARWGSMRSASRWDSASCLSFGYWCTDFLVVQRAMAADLDGRRAAHAADRRGSRRCCFRFWW